MEEGDFPSPPRPPNGLTADLKARTLGISGPNAALMLLVVGIIAVQIYRLKKDTDTSQAAQEQLTATESRLTEYATKAEAHLHERMEALFGRVNQLEATLQTQSLLLTQNNGKVTEGQHALEKAVVEGQHAVEQRILSAVEAKFDQQREQIRAIDASLNAQTQELRALGHDQTQEHHADIQDVRNRLDILRHNVANPAQQLPFGVPQPRDERPGGLR